MQIKVCEAERTDYCSQITLSRAYRGPYLLTALTPSSSVMMKHGAEVQNEFVSRIPAALGLTLTQLSNLVRVVLSVDCSPCSSAPL
jgi:hypothetical protein